MRPDRNGTVLLAEDEPEVRSYLEMALRCHGYHIETAQDGEEVLAYLQSGASVSAVLLDIIMPRKDGMETLREIRRLDTELPVIMVSGAASPLNIVEAIKSGATDFLGKPVNHEELRIAIKRAMDARPSHAPETPEPGAIAASGQAFFGTNQRMKELQAVIAQIAWSEVPVLITGETGAGKEELARQVHALSPRTKRPRLKLNGAALPSELVESELFGYERGAFTGAFQRKPGMFELADGGTLLLDEIGDMDFKLQAKLLQVLQDHEFQRLGGKETVRVDVRVIAATHNDLERAIAAGKFRQDLYYRLNVVTLFVPPLRERKDDIIPLAKILLEKHAHGDAGKIDFTPQLQQALLVHDWPGNVRELENVIRKLVVLRDPQLISRELSERAARRSINVAPALPVGAMETVPVSAPILEQVRRAKHQAETEAILAALTSTQWNRKKAAALLKIDYKALLYKMKKLGIEGKVASLPPGEDEF